VTAPATWYFIEGNADYYWRVMAPARVIGAKVNPIPEEGGYFAVTTPNEDTAFPWRLHDDADEAYIEYPAHEGSAAVWTRPEVALAATHIRAMRTQLGLRTVAEVDDNYVGNPRLNPFLHSNRFDDTRQAQHLKALASMDGIIVTTPLLRDIYFKALRKAYGKRHVPPIHVCGNHLFPDDWPVRVERDGPVRVGWMGSPAHVWDVDDAWPAMLHARNLGCDTYMVGYNPADPDDFAIETERALAKTKQWARAITHHVPWQKLDGTRRLALPFDIGLAPLKHNHFTMGKSDIKAIEYAIAGAAPVLANTPVYNRTWRHGETCLLASSPGQMLECVDLLIRQPALRERIVEAAQQYVREERDITRHTDEWKEAILGDQADLHRDRPGDRKDAVGARAD
jgi:glycosyltransferase involved in cell wall biosynthesis